MRLNQSIDSSSHRSGIRLATFSADSMNSIRTGMCSLAARAKICLMYPVMRSETGVRPHEIGARYTARKQE